MAEQHFGYAVLISKMSDGNFGIDIPDLPGIATIGTTYDEAVRNAREAIELHIEGMRADGEDPPSPTHYELITL